MKHELKIYKVKEKLRKQIEEDKKKNNSLVKTKSILTMIGIVLLTIFLSLSLISAETEIYPLNKTIDLKFTCTLNNAIPSVGTKYNITISYPNGSAFINNQQTTALGNGAFNYTTTFTSLGLYKVQMFCYDGTYSFSNEGFYEITGNGSEKPEGIVIVLFSIIFLIIFGFMLYEMILCFGHFASLDLDVIDLAKIFGTYFALLGVYLISITYLGSPMIENWLLLFIKIGAFTHLLIPMTGFFISITVGSLRKKQVDFGTRRILRRQKIGN